MNISKFLGCCLIVVGSSIGSGILALPIQFSGAGFLISAVAIVAMWILMTMTGFLVIEINLALPAQACSFNSMAEKTLGPIGKTITWISYLLLLCSILAAYVAGESSLITSMLNSAFNIQVPGWLSALFFVITLGSAVFWGTKTVDYFNRGLISFKGFFLIATLMLILPHIDIDLLTNNQNFVCCNSGFFTYF
jgi:tyrosine-specific transport protein